MNTRYPGSFRAVAVPRFRRSLAVIGKDLFTSRRELFPMLLKAGEHSEIALIQYRTAVPLDVAGASALLLFSSTVLRLGCTAEEKRQSADDGDILVHGNCFAPRLALLSGAS